MKIIQVSSLFAAVFASGCVASMEDAPFDAQVNVPEDLQIAWSIENNNVDLSGLLIPFDIGVFRTDMSNGTMAPLPNTRVEITSSFGGSI